MKNKGLQVAINSVWEVRIKERMARLMRRPACSIDRSFMIAFETVNSSRCPASWAMQRNVIDN